MDYFKYQSAKLAPKRNVTTCPACGVMRSATVKECRGCDHRHPYPFHRAAVPQQSRAA